VNHFIESRKGGILDLFQFNVEERAALAMATQFDERRKAYWEALNPHQNSLKLNDHSSAKFSALDPLQNMMLDFEFTSTTISTHPALLLKKHRWNYAFSKEHLILADDLSTQRPNQTVTVFGIVQIIQSPPTANGMFFITLDDETGFLNLVIKPPIYEKFKDLIQTQWAMLIRGRVQRSGAYTSILVDAVIAPHLEAKPTRLRRRHGYQAALPHELQNVNEM
jgi:error-prone DNA polymerase